MITNSYRIFFLLLFLGVHGASAALVADIGGDYVDELAAPTNWEYRYYNNLASSGGALTADRAIGDLGHRGFGIPFTPPDDPMTSILGKRTDTSKEFEIYASSANSAVEGTDLLMQPGHNPGYSVLARFTFTAAMITNNGNQMSTAGSFRRQATQGPVVVRVFLNDDLNNSLWMRDSGQTSGGFALTQADGTFDLSGITVKAGDTISFFVDSNGIPLGDETAVRGTISLVPEPVSYGLLAGGGMLLLAVYLRRRA